MGHSESRFLFKVKTLPLEGILIVGNTPSLPFQVPVVHDQVYMLLLKILVVLLELNEVVMILSKVLIVVLQCVVGSG